MRREKGNGKDECIAGSLPLFSSEGIKKRGEGERDSRGITR